MNLGLSAPAAVIIEVRESQKRAGAPAAATAARRLFRLSRQIGVAGIELARPVPFDPGRPVVLALVLPGAAEPITLDARVELLGHPSEQDGEAGGCGLALTTPSIEGRAALTGYVRERLGLDPGAAP